MDTKNPKTVEELVKALKSYYKKKDINSENPGIPEKYKGKVCSSAAQVGENYGVKAGGNYGALKIVVISSERAYDKTEDEDPHTMKANDSGAGYHKNHQWYRTIAFVAEIAKELKVDGYHTEKNLSYFAHLNATIYRQNGHGANEGPYALFEFCERENYIRGELDILAPSIIWTQGNRAQDAFISSGYFAKSSDIKDLKDDCYIKKSAAKIWIRTPHPTSRHHAHLYSDGRFEKIGEIIDILKQPLS